MVIKDRKTTELLWPIFVNRKPRPPPRNTEAHIAQQPKGRFVRDYALTSGLRPNWIWSWSGNSNWDSAALTFAADFTFGLHQLASSRFHCLLWALIPGA
jgi:hypothetical protein